MDVHFFVSFSCSFSSSSSMCWPDSSAICIALAAIYDTSGANRVAKMVRKSEGWKRSKRKLQLMAACVTRLGR